MIKERAVKRVLSLSLLLTVVMSSGALYFRHKERQSAIKAGLDWTKMLPLPESAENIDVDVRGSIFTRELEIEFQASEEDIKSWLIESPGTSFSRRDSRTDSIVPYKISESDALFAQVTVNWDTLTVVIHTYWS